VPSSHGSSSATGDDHARSDKGSQVGALGVLRTQGEGLARWLEKELEGFSMPDTM